MTENPCGQEGLVTAALRSDRWTDELRAHVDRCAECGDLARAARWMIGLAERLRSHQNLPDARLVWLEARLAAERRLAERALRPIAYTRVVGSFAAVVTLVLATVWAWPALFDGGSAQWLAALARTPSVVVAAAIGGLAVLASRKLL